MKKRLSTIVLLTLAAVTFLWACGGYSPPRGLVWEETKANYVVFGNGTSAVQQGRYVYFLNGMRPPEVDADRTSSTNRWGNIVRGGIYRARLLGNSAENVISETRTERNWNVVPEITYFDAYRGEEYRSDQVLMDFYSTIQQIPVLQQDGEFEYEYHPVFEAVPVVPMVGAVSGRDVGLFIFGNHIYYTSPATNVNRDREVEFNRTAFWRTRLDGRGTERIFTSADSGVPPHGFYYVFCPRGNPRNDRVYLVVLEDGNLLSFGMYANGRGNIRRMIIAEDVTNAIFPRRPVFDISDRPVRCEETDRYNIRAEDYIYFTRDALPDEDFIVGNILERIRPDGMGWVFGGYRYRYRNGVREYTREGEYAWREGGERLTSGNNTIGLHSVRNNVLFFTMQGSGGVTEMHFNNFLPGRDAISTVRHSPLVDNVGRYTEIIPFRDADDSMSNEAYAITFTADTIGRRKNIESVALVRNLSAPRFEFFDGEFVYFTAADERLHRVSINADFDRNGDTSQVMTDEPILTTFVRPALTANHIIFFRDIDIYAPNYTFFKRATINPNEREFWVGVRCEEDFPEEDEDEDEEI